MFRKVSYRKYIYRCLDLIFVSRDYSFSADIWSVGVVFYAMVFGVECYNEAEDYSQVWTDRLAALETEDGDFYKILKLCLDRNPKTRAKLDHLLALPFFDIFSGKDFPVELQRITRHSEFS